MFKFAKFNSIIKDTAKFRGYCEKMQFTTVKLTTDIKYVRGENRFFREREPILLATPAKTLDSWKVSRLREWRFWNLFRPVIFFLHLHGLRPFENENFYLKRAEKLQSVGKIIIHCFIKMIVLKNFDINEISLYM